MKKHIVSQHDKFTKDSLQNKLIAQDFFKAHLPQSVQRLIDWKTLELQSGSFIDEDYRDQVKPTASAVVPHHSYYFEFSVRCTQES